MDIQDLTLSILSPASDPALVIRQILTL